MDLDIGTKGAKQALCPALGIVAEDESPRTQHTLGCSGRDFLTVSFVEWGQINRC